MTTKQADLIPYETRKKYYFEGHYRMDVPPVSHAQWTPDSWIKYIDGSGQWITPVARKIEAANPFDKPMIDCGFYAWITANQDTRTGRYIEDVKAYLASEGFVMHLDLLTSRTVRCLRYQHQWWWREVI
jgi:hypothetical protein